jgi:hypothetical protein
MIGIFSFTISYALSRSASCDEVARQLSICKSSITLVHKRYIEVKHAKNTIEGPPSYLHYLIPQRELWFFTLLWIDASCNAVWYIEWHILTSKSHTHICRSYK